MVRSICDQSTFPLWVRTGPEPAFGPRARGSYFTEMCSGSEAGSYLRLIDFAHHSILGLREIKKKNPEIRAATRQVLNERGFAALQGSTAWATNYRAFAPDTKAPGIVNPEMGSTNPGAAKHHRQRVNF